MLLLHSMPSDYVIESKLTWQKFKLGASDTPLTVAAKRHQYAMIKLLLPYYNQLAESSQISEKSRQYASAAREAGLKAWSFYTTTINTNNQNEFLIPTEYSSIINNLIDVFSHEELGFGQTDFTQLSENTGSVMRSFLDRLTPKEAVELDNHIDVELLLLAAYQLYVKRFADFTSWAQRNAFCIRVIGLIQSTLSPETAKIYCKSLGLYNIFDHQQIIEDRTTDFKLSGNEAFYRDARESLSGPGGKYLCSAPITGVMADAGSGIWSNGMPCGTTYETYIEEKHQVYKKLCYTSQCQSQSHRPGV